jgi:acetylornithine deacetylase/succinyl-diaminopimelate desuccinylase-like protein
MNAIPDRFIGDLMALLEIPSVAAWADHEPELRRTACWLKQRFEEAGLHARLLEDIPRAPPYVHAQTEIRPDRPTILLYGHYDVQPADAADGWTTPPFQPTLRDGKIYGRGATDQKMNLLLPIFALETVDMSTLPWNVKFFYEGEEEILSPHLRPALEQYAELLRCDAVFSTDGWQYSADQGDLRLGLRGFCALEVIVRGASKDLHSGTFGGAAPNPALALARVLAMLHNTDGSVAVPGFSDGILPPGKEELEAIREHPFDHEGWLQRAGLRISAEIAGVSIPEQTGFHPSVEINAFEAGKYDAGFRTIIPASARARISCRLVLGQEPSRVAELMRGFIDAQIPRLFDCEIHTLPGMAYRILRADRIQQLAANILTKIDGRQPRYSCSGGSIPMPGEIEAVLGVKTVIFGFGLPDQNMHSIDEFCRLADIQRGLGAWDLLLRETNLTEV